MEGGGTTTCISWQGLPQTLGVSSLGRAAGGENQSAKRFLLKPTHEKFHADFKDLEGLVCNTLEKTLSFGLTGGGLETEGYHALHDGCATCGF